jgi:putative tryptophan/tyrosine transport system substrate-binding protein
MTRRRDFVMAIGLSAVVAPWASVAQQSAGKVPRIGFLGSGSAAAVAKPLEAFRAGLRELGYVEGRNIAIEYRWGEGKFERLPELAAELIRLKVDLIAVWGTPGTLAAKRATSSLPIVMLAVGDPEDTGLVASLARPGGNVTGIANLGGAVVAKQLELLTQIVPGIARIAVLRNLRNPSLISQAKGAEAAARSLGLQIQFFDVQSLDDFNAAFARMSAAQAAGLLVLADPLFLTQGKPIAELAIRHRLPAVTARSEMADAGVMVAYGGSTVEAFRSGAIFIDRVLRGAKPADLPVQQVTTFEFIVNLKTANALGIQFPPHLLVRADRVIE